MKEILRSINKIPGVRGTLLIGQDGLLIDSDIEDSQDSGTMAAVASSVNSTLSHAIARMNAGGKMTRFVMNGSAGSIVLLSAGDAIFLTLVRKDANMGMVLVELKDAAAKLADMMDK
ncbi:MAG: roadblock/LC7 domain-containing protein [Planctomycetes bacterium]|nr:roadblock/LC7 domain-containing protein [Planctomycetota bacterium]